MLLVGSGELAMCDCGGGGISVVSFSGGVKVSEGSLNAPHFNSRLPPLRTGVPRDTFKPGCVGGWSAPVHLVLAVRSKPEIAQAIVRFIAVDVVDILVGPSAVCQCPSYPVRPMPLAVY